MKMLTAAIAKNWKVGGLLGLMLLGLVLAACDETKTPAPTAISQPLVTVTSGAPTTGVTAPTSTTANPTTSGTAPTPITTSPSAKGSFPPILFVHGNGDS